MKLKWESDSLYPGPEDSPGFLLWQLTNSWQRAIRTTLTPLGLTHVQFVLMACLAWLEDHGEGPISQRELADQAGTDPMMTSQVVRALVEAAYVERQSQPTDQRAFAVRLTESGRDQVRRALPAVEATDKAFFAERQQALQRLAIISAALL